ncbi:hypothetical protein POTOM_052451 [Populus tomentosa]|uniref:Uncharacterized protein n=1 Tax=Populus tomentosa TaxID=118781 RepID=A0A8X8C7A1_POPTO|nr:hypothetical protein POTOM_052451 [Populus tomentosa]
MWSSLAVDLLLGILIGSALLLLAESVCLWILTFANGITNELLCSGCVWLMGVPAGFKLNTELAGVLGVISLNAIQVWPTLWILIDFLFIYFIKGLGLLGILFGATIPAALIIDMASLATLHVSTLHWAISILYSRQIQALAALGRKWNPLRQRLHSFDYTNDSLELACHDRVCSSSEKSYLKTDRGKNGALCSRDVFAFSIGMGGLD